MMRKPSHYLAVMLLTGPLFAAGGEWRLLSESSRHVITEDLSYAKRTVQRVGDGRQVTAHLTFFTSKNYRLEVLDTPSGGSLAEVFRSNDCVAGVNGGFFHPDGRPLGLVVAQGERMGRFATSGSLTTGLIYSDHRGIHIVRRSQFRDHPRINALIQTGPYLVEYSRPIRGLSTSNPRRRTFVATDWRGNWALGATVSSLSLADLGDLLGGAHPITGWKVNRAINLDGGSSTGFYFDRGAGVDDVRVSPWKPVAHLLGVVPK